MDFNRCAKIVQTERSTKAENNVFKLFTFEVQPILFKVVQTEGSTKAENNVFKLFTSEVQPTLSSSRRLESLVRIVVEENSYFSDFSGRPFLIDNLLFYNLFRRVYRLG